MNFTAIGEQLSASPWLALPIVFLAGVLTSLTPCVYPMIPITAAIVGGGSTDGEKPDRRRTIYLTFSYVVGLAVVYALLGVIAGLTGTMFGSISTNPWLYFGMANLMLAAGLSMLDVFPIRLPAGMQARLATAGAAGRASGAFIMGAVSGLVAAPCSAPVMAAVLTWVTVTRRGVLGFAYLLAFSLGMCALLVAVGLFSGTVSRLPRSGPWMLRIKRAFGLVMIGVAEYYLVKMGQLLF